MMSILTSNSTMPPSGDTPMIIEETNMLWPLLASGSFGLLCYGIAMLVFYYLYRHMQANTRDIANNIPPNHLNIPPTTMNVTSLPISIITSDNVISTLIQHTDETQNANVQNGDTPSNHSYESSFHSGGTDRYDNSHDQMNKSSMNSITEIKISISTNSTNSGSTISSTIYSPIAPDHYQPSSATRNSLGRGSSSPEPGVPNDQMRLNHSANVSITLYSIRESCSENESSSSEDLTCLNHQ